MVLNLVLTPRVSIPSRRRAAVGEPSVGYPLCGSLPRFEPAYVNVESIQCPHAAQRLWFSSPDVRYRGLRRSHHGRFESVVLGFVFHNTLNALCLLTVCAPYLLPMFLLCKSRYRVQTYLPPPRI
jgi:hypothetical protein